MQKITQRIVNPATWVASTQTPQIVLPTTGIITEVRVRANMTATLTAAAVADATRRAIDGLIISGTKNFFNLSGNINLGTLLALLNLADHGVSGLGANTDVGATSFNQSYTYHPGSFPKTVRWDTSVVIPAKKLVGQLSAVINAPAAAVTDAAGNITAGSYYVEVDMINDLPIMPSMKVPAAAIQVLHPASNNASFPGSINVSVPVGYWLRRIVIMCLDQTAVVPVRSDAYITGVQLTKPNLGVTVVETNWEDLKYSTARRYSILGDIEDGVLGAIATTRPGYNGSMHLPAGFGIIDCRDLVDTTVNPLGAVYGMDLRGAPTGLYQLNIANQAFNVGQSFIILWDMIADMDANFIGS
jgi:hypothetical protein